MFSIFFLYTNKKAFTIVADVDSLDWKDYDASTIISNVCNHKELDCGPIILCHNGAKYTADALVDVLYKKYKEGSARTKPLKLIVLSLKFDIIDLIKFVEV